MHQRLLTLDVAPEELERRRESAPPPPDATTERGYRRLFMDHVTQADDGVDFDFMTAATRDASVP